MCRLEALAVGKALYARLYSKSRFKKGTFDIPGFPPVGGGCLNFCIRSIPLQSDFEWKRKNTKWRKERAGIRWKVCRSKACVLGLGWTRRRAVMFTWYYPQCLWGAMPINGVLFFEVCRKHLGFELWILFDLFCTCVTWSGWIFVCVCFFATNNFVFVFWGFEKQGGWGNEWGRIRCFCCLPA